MTRAFSAALTLSVLMIAGSGVARAGDPNAEKARAHFQQGDTFFKLDKYAPALQEFEQAYLAKQDPSFLYNIAQCHRLMGNRVEAIRFYKRYINDAPTAPNRPVAEKHIHDLEAAIEADHLVGSRPAPPPPPVPVSPVPPPPGAATPPPTPSGSAPPPSPPPLALNATPPPLSDTVLTNSPAGPSPSDEHPIYTKWWFWTAIGGVVVTGVILTLLLNRDPSCPSGWQCQ